MRRKKPGWELNEHRIENYEILIICIQNAHLWGGGGGGGGGRVRIGRMKKVFNNC